MQEGDRVLTCSAEIVCIYVGAERASRDPASAFGNFGMSTFRPSAAINCSRFTEYRPIQAP
jgi:hypothetical protein